LECNRKTHLSWVESHATSPGAFDVNYCVNGVEGWIELKAFPKIDIKISQVIWAEERIKAGGYPLLLIQNNDKYALLPSINIRQIRATPTWGLLEMISPIIFHNDIGENTFFNALENPGVLYDK